MTKESRIKEIEDQLGLTYEGDLVPGHMGACVARFARVSDGRKMVAKFLTAESPGTATADMAANIKGYNSIIKAKGESIMPTGYSLQNVGGSPVILMDNLGESFKGSHDADKYKKLVSSLERVVRETVVPEDGSGEKIRKTLVAKISFFGDALRRILRDEELEALLSDIPGLQSEKVAICLLDFTPDNVFATDNGIAFIDPWDQESYLGNPAVSFGQFTALARDIYKLDGSEAGLADLMGFMREELPVILETSEKEVARAFSLGRALQFTLSAYVRIESDPERSRELAVKALGELRQAAS